MESANGYMSQTNPISCTIKPPVPIKIGDHKVEFLTGCHVIDVTFPNVFYVEIGEIHFKNFYTANLTIKVRTRTTEKEGTSTDSKWKTCLNNYQLMPDPHSDTAAEEYFVIGKQHVLFDLINVIAVRIIIRQPSPVWKEFRIEELKFYKASLFIPKEVKLPGWLNDITDNKIKTFDNGPNVEELSKEMQNLMATSQLAKSCSNNSTSIRRYDVDGCYDINLLSYT
ncbi:DgyrCDS5474 [Dimorphilus gyrociliatus]|uniref:DgyrCDS5474 n=1 Tax=Dimorphilus gyrociliatus TaxID=2664684 RepID=A0A7I8VK45_9ANNE|nr:DgyrCDS5474 [Dimorphilus gyrociliatus]